MAVISLSRVRRLLIQDGDVGKMAKLLSVVQTVPDNEPIVDREAHVLDAHINRPPRPLVQQ